MIIHVLCLVLVFTLMNHNPPNSPQLNNKVYKFYHLFEYEDHRWAKGHCYQSGKKCSGVQHFVFLSIEGNIGNISNAGYT